jgi:hypothetical protein
MPSTDTEGGDVLESPSGVERAGRRVPSERNTGSTTSDGKESDNSDDEGSDRQVIYLDVWAT